MIISRLNVSIFLTSLAVSSFSQSILAKDPNPKQLPSEAIIVSASGSKNPSAIPDYVAYGGLLARIEARSPENAELFLQENFGLNKNRGTKFIGLLKRSIDESEEIENVKVFCARYHNPDYYSEQDYREMEYQLKEIKSRKHNDIDNEIKDVFGIKVTEKLAAYIDEEIRPNLSYLEYDPLALAKSRGKNVNHVVKKMCGKKGTGE